MTVHSFISTEEEEIKKVSPSDKTQAKKKQLNQEWTVCLLCFLAHIACVCLSHSDLGGFIESVDPVHEVLLVVGLQEELPHPSIDD